VDVKITQLPAAASVTTDDVFPIVDDPGGTPVTQKATVAQLKLAMQVTFQVYTGVAPPAAPDDPTQPALFYPSGGGPLSQWDVGGGAWV